MKFLFCERNDWDEFFLMADPAGRGGLSNRPESSRRRSAGREHPVLPPRGDHSGTDERRGPKA